MEQWRGTYLFRRVVSVYLKGTKKKHVQVMSHANALDIDVAGEERWLRCSIGRDKVSIQER